VKFFKNFVTHLGYKKYLNCSDGEHSIVALKAKVASEIAEVEAIPRESIKGDHQANGAAENGVKEVKRQVRVMKARSKRRLEGSCRTTTQFCVGCRDTEPTC
jgi:hypothetical protein